MNEWTNEWMNAYLQYNTYSNELYMNNIRDVINHD